MSTFLPRKRSSFYTRLVIPKRLRVYFDGRREVWRSLGTVDKEEAAYRSLQFKVSAQRLFLNLKRHGGRMTKHQIETLVSKWLEEALEESEDIRSGGRPLNDDDVESLQLGMSYQFDGYQEALVSRDYRRVEKEADELLEAAGLPALDHASLDFMKLCRRLLRAKIEYLRIEYDRWEGEYRDDHLKGRSLVEEKSEVAPSLPFTTVLEKYLTANPRPTRTADPLKAEFARFVGVIGGDKPIRGIAKADAVRYKESLQERKCSLLTCIKHLSNLDTFFKWAEVHGFSGPSPVKGLAPSKRQAKKHALRRQPSSDEQLITIFGSPEFLKQRTARPERYWIVLLLLFQICRREEVGQLYLKDIGESDGITYLNITDKEPDQTLKNEGSRRKVPLHSALVKLGFPKYVQSIKKQGHARLFPQLTRKGHNGYADPVGKWFGRMVTGLGPTDPALVIHSLRHGGITKLHSAGVPSNIVETLTGHSAGNVHGQYVHKELISMKTLQEGLERLRYDLILHALKSKGQDVPVVAAKRGRAA